MALELRLQQKLTQQLVMTPQLQQAIKLLQLNHLEMAEILRQELEENPVLEERGEAAEAEGSEAGDGAEGADGGQEAASPGEAAEAADGEAAEAAQESYEATSSSAAEAAPEAPAPLEATGSENAPEPSSGEMDREIDWEAYLDSYSYSLPATAGSGQGEELPPFEAGLCKPTSLHDHLRWQVQMCELSDEQTRIAALLIEEINDDGYLAEDAVQNVADELEVPVAQVEEVLAELQELDPVGVAARNLRECLLIQLRHLNFQEPLLFEVVDKHLAHVERRNYQAIARELKISVPEVGEIIKLIGQLEPRPGRIYSDKEPQYITPDIYVYKVGQDYAIVLNEDGLPKLRVSNYYRSALKGMGGDTKNYVQDKLRSALWLIRSIHMRQRTIYKVMESILKFQREFFDKGVAYLKPLVLKDVAEDVEMHESTISRVTSNKYVHTPQGIYELKYFFNSSIARTGGESIASESVREAIRKLIAEENPKAPYSDQQVVEVLKERNIDIARRTVAKYREMLKIPSSSKRKQVF